MVVESRNYIATPPGAALKEIITNRGITQKELAARLECSEKHLSRLINGEVELTPAMAYKLEMVFGAPASFWNNLEATYREKKAKAEAENELDEDEKIAKELPYNEMAKYGWVENTRNIVERTINLRKYFGVSRLSSLDNSLITCIACRRLSVTDKGDLALMAWAQQARRVAENIEVEPINVKRLISCLPEMRDMTLETSSVVAQKLKNILASCGVALVFLPNLSGAYLQGATFYSGKKIVVGMTSRGKDADRFWFSFFHEIGHIVLGHIGKPNGTSLEDEKAADKFAMDTLIPSGKVKQLESGTIDRNTVVAFAKEIGVDPGIVVGRLQKDGCIKYSTMNDLKSEFVVA